MMAKMANEKAAADAKKAVAQAKVAEVQAKIAQGAYAKSGGSPAPAGGLGNAKDPKVEAMLAQAKIEDAKTRRMEVQDKTRRSSVEDENRDLDRASKENLATLGLAKDILIHHINANKVESEAKEVKKDITE